MTGGIERLSWTKITLESGREEVDRGRASARRKYLEF